MNTVAPVELLTGETARQRELDGRFGYHQPPDPNCICEGTGLREPGNPAEGYCPLCGPGAALRANASRAKAQDPAAARGLNSPAKDGDAPVLGAVRTASAVLGGRAPETSASSSASQGGPLPSGVLLDADNECPECNQGVVREGDSYEKCPVCNGNYRQEVRA